MSAQEEKLCDRCHKRPATIHFRHGHTGEKENICETCSKEPILRKKLSSQEKQVLTGRFKEAIQKQNGKCMYCGEPAVFCIHFTSSISRSLKQSPDDSDEPFRVLCEMCHNDEGDFYLAWANSLPEGPVNDDQAKSLIQMSAKLDEFMKKKIQQRRSGDADH